MVFCTNCHLPINILPFTPAHKSFFSFLSFYHILISVALAGQLQWTAHHTSISTSFWTSQSTSLQLKSYKGNQKPQTRTTNNKRQLNECLYGETFHLDRLGTKWHPRDLVIQSNFTWFTVISLYCHWDISLHTCNQPFVFRVLKTELTFWKGEMESPTLFCRLYSRFLLCSPKFTYNTASKRKLKLKNKQTYIPLNIFLIMTLFLSRSISNDVSWQTPSQVEPLRRFIRSERLQLGRK